MGLLRSIKSIFVKTDNNTRIDEITNLLLASDVSYATTRYIVEKIKNSNNIDNDLQKIVGGILSTAEVDLHITSKPFVVFMYGVNGSGKTTTIVKLVNMFQKQGKKVVVAACDTFRSAAADQLSVSLNKLNCSVITAEKENADPASVAFNASKKAVEENYDVLIIDTAGRLHTNTNLMSELQKIHKVTIKNLPSAGYVNIAIVDSTIGQNSLIQIQKFNEVIPISGVIITKLDTSSKGGALLSIIHEMKKKVYFVCYGRGFDEIKKFEAEAFTKDFID